MLEMKMVRQYNKEKAACAFSTNEGGETVEAVKQKSYSADALLAEFFAQDDLKSLAADAGALLDCPLLVLDDTFHAVSYTHLDVYKRQSSCRPCAN